MSAITWVNTDPTDASNASDLDDAIRDFAVQTATGLGAGLQWPGSGGGSAASAGMANLGTARLAISGGRFGLALGAGLLSYDTYRGALVEGSGLSNLMGHASMMERPFSSETSSVWRHQSGSSTTNVAKATFEVTFASAYSGVPYVELSVSTTLVLSSLSVVGTSGFTSYHSFLDGTTPSVWTLLWSSEGTLAAL